MADPSLQDRVGIIAFETRMREHEGKTGLDPLDPVQPLTSVRVLGILDSVGPFQFGSRTANVRFTYADGSSRTYRTWLMVRPGMFTAWRYSTLDRAFTPHLELPNLPIAGLDAPIRIGAPVPLAINGLPPLLSVSFTDLERLFRSPGSLWAPNGDELILPATDPDSLKTALWLVRLNGTPPSKLASGPSEVTWSPDGRFVVFGGVNSVGPLLAASMPDGTPVWSSQSPNGHLSASFTVKNDAMLFAREGVLLRMLFYPVTRAIPVRVRDLPGHELSMQPGPQSSIAIDGGGRRIAYACGPDLCLTDIDGGTPIHVTVGDTPTTHTYPWVAQVARPADPYSDGLYPPGHPQFHWNLPPRVGLGPYVPNWNTLRPTWSPDGQRLAVTSADPQAGPQLNRPPRLSILDRSGSLLAQINIGPNGPIDAPHWTADGQFILLRAYPENGRRIVAVEVATSRVFDLSQPGWDALFSPSPDGSRLLLTNGRGGFWIAPIERRS